MALHGRELEQAAIADLLASARQGQGSSLALLGEAGSGKSTLLADARERALGDDMRVVSTSGIESEAPLAFAALQRLPTKMVAAISAQARGIATKELSIGTPGPPLELRARGSQAFTTLIGRNKRYVRHACLLPRHGPLVRLAKYR